jgi:alpha-2-macroglobulin
MKFDVLLQKAFDIRVLVAVMLIALFGFFALIKPNEGGPAFRQPPREPTVFTVTPAGDQVDRLSPIEVTFAKAPAEREGSRLLSLEPAVEGEYVWLSERTILFQPAYPGLLRGLDYTINVPPQPDAGHTSSFSRSFTTAGALDVVSVIPAPNDVEVPEGVQILIQFNRSVAPLTLLSEQPTGQAVIFDPPLAGHGEWLNTSLYRFVPELGALQPNTTYEARVPAEQSSEPDGVLSQDYVWSFQTYGPALVRVTPGRDTQFVGPQQPVEMEFNQPMNRASVESGFNLTSGGSSVSGSFTWSADSTKATFRPDGGLALNSHFEAVLPAGLRGANGGETANEQRVAFQTVGEPQIKSTSPNQGSTTAERYGIYFQFATPMDEDSFESRITVSSFASADIQYYVDFEGLGLSINVPLEASTSYTVTLSSGITDRYGQPLPPYTLSFTTGQRPSSVTLAIPNQVATYSASTEQLLYFHAINTTEAKFTLYPLTRSEMSAIQKRGYISPGPGPYVPSQAPIATWTENTAGELNEVLLSSTSLARTASARLPKGDYLVRSGSDFNSELAFSVVDTALITKTSFDELLVWALDLDSGSPLSGASLQASGPGLADASATTDADGLASFPLPHPDERGNDFNDYLVETNDASRYGVAVTNWQQGSYSLGLPTEIYPQKYVAHLYTDRPIYRTGEEVFYKAVIREDDDATYFVPQGLQDVTLKIYDSQGQELVSQDVTVNEFGTFAGSFQLPNDAATGDYGMQLTYKHSRFSQVYDEYLTGTSFLVAEFRRPEFQVEATTVQPDYISGETIEADFEASFYFGGAVTNAKVDWTALSFPASPSFEGYEAYSFSDYDYYRESTVFRQPERGSGTVTTDENGIARVSVPAVIEGNEGTQSYQISAGVLDATGQVVAGSVDVLVHPAAAYAGIHPAEYVASSGEPAELDLVSLDLDGNPLPNRDITVNVYEREWITTKEQTAEGARRYRSEPRDTLVDTLTATTNAAGEASVSYTPQSSGTLRIVAEITDSQGRTARSATYLWVSGGAFASWQITNDDTLQLVADKEQYQVGDTAQILVPAPFEGAIGLVTTERGKVISRDVRAFLTNSESLEIPINDIAVPNIFVGVVLYRPPTTEDPVPRYKVGYVELPVSTDVRLLNVSIQPDVDQAEPGQTVRYDIEVKDSTGKGVRSELSVAVVDKAVLSLTQERSITGLRAFWFERGLGVITASSLAVSIDRSNDVISEPSAGGKGGGGLDDPRLRQEFRNTAYWDAQLVTDDNGKASVSVIMPDNLTTWRMQVRAISGDILVGEATNELVSTQPLLLRPALPRFLRVGDDVMLRTLVRNATKQTQDVTVTLAAEGVNVEGDLDKTVTVAPGASEEISWPANVSAEGTASLTMTADAGGGLSDAVLQELPIYLDVTPETTATGGVVTDQRVEETVYIPSYTIQKEGLGSLYVGVQASLIGSLPQQLSAFAPTIWESTEQKASRVIATLAAAKAEPGGKLLFDENRLRSDIADLISLQRGDGGWPWCRLCNRSDPQITGWVLQALGAWQDAGHQVDPQLLDDAVAYVNAYIQRFRDVENPADPSFNAFLLYSLSVSGRQYYALSTMRSLLEQDRQNLTNWGRAYLLLGFAESGLTRKDVEIQQLLNDLAANVQPSANGNHWEDPRAGSYSQTGPRTTALVLNALSIVDPRHPLIEETTRWLVIALNTGECRTQLEQAQAIVALSSFVQQTGERGASYRFDVRLDNRNLVSGRLEAGDKPAVESADVPITQLTAGKPALLSLERDFEAPGRMYYTMNLRYITPAAGIEALSRGFAISHNYSLLDNPDTEITSARIGDVVRVRLTVMLPADRNYVVVEDFLPAGLEPIDPNLAIVEPAVRAQLATELAAANRPEDLEYYAPWFAWYYNPWQQSDLLDDRVRLSTDALAKGVYEFIYYARATTPGDFFVAPAHVEETNFPDVFGRSDSGRFTVQP